MAGSERVFGRKLFWKRGEPWVWLTGGALAVTLLLLVAMIGVVVVRGLATFWMSDLVQFETNSGEIILGEVVDSELHHETGQESIQIKTGNRDISGLDFRWLDAKDIKSRGKPQDAVKLERLEYGNFYGYVQSLDLNGIDAAGSSLSETFGHAMSIMSERRRDLHDFQEKIGDINRDIKSKQLALKKNQPELYRDTPVHKITNSEISKLIEEFDSSVDQLGTIESNLKASTVRVSTADARSKDIPLLEIVRVSYPNQANVFNKLQYYGVRVIELLTAEPRESNTEGGLFPAIFGTVMLIFLMAFLSFPLGVLAGIYLREYAKDGVFVRFVRIGVNNLAGIPSIVYGIFGLGFFVYGVGSSVDQFFFAESLPEPTFGTGGILWAALTLGILTIPVVIVSVEEALGSIPGAVRQSSLALGATKLQTLLRITLPMASPGIMTGFILAMARAAGEVAPLMITGVVKLAPTLPLDSHFPFLHPERKFMHLGFHIYDISSQSPNVEAAKPMVYVTTLLLLLIVLTMSALAIWLRSRMKKTYAMGAL